MHPQAGKLPAPSMLVKPEELRSAYFDNHPDPDDARQRIAFGTSGHRGSSLDRAFNQDHILAIVQAICRYRRAQGIDGPMYLGWDTHALSDPARRTAVDVLARNGVTVVMDSSDRPTPTPVISRAILVHNRGRQSGLADGIVITPSHNPPRDGGIKYDPPSGGPADGSVTAWIEAEANRLLDDRTRGLGPPSPRSARTADTVRRFDYVSFYADQLGGAIDMDVVRGANLRIGVDPLGGASLDYFDAIGDRYGVRLDVVNRQVDPTFAFMMLDRDGVIRMDPSSRYAMAGLIAMREDFDVAFGCDPDADRHGIVTRRGGLMEPNQYLAVCVDYLFRQRTRWPQTAAVGKSVVTSGMIDRVASRLGRRVMEVPVGFKHFVNGFLTGALAFAGEESAGASFLECDGSTWTTDKDGLMMGFLAAEMRARSGRDPAEQYRMLAETLGESFYERIDEAASPADKMTLSAITTAAIGLRTLAGDSVSSVLSTAPGNGAPIGGIKVVTPHGWFAVRPSGTEAVYKLYAESFRSQDHLRRIQDEARALIEALLKKGR